MRSFQRSIQSIIQRSKIFAPESGPELGEHTPKNREFAGDNPLGKGCQVSRIQLKLLLQIILALKPKVVLSFHLIKPPLLQSETNSEEFLSNTTSMLSMMSRVCQRMLDTQELRQRYFSAFSNSLKLICTLRVQ